MKSPRDLTAQSPEPNMLSTRTAQSVSQDDATQGVDLHKVKFTFAQLKLLGQSTCQRLEREFVKQNQLFEAESSQLGTSRESISLNTNRTDQSAEPTVRSSSSVSSLHGDSESTDIRTCLEVEEAPETGVNTARRTPICSRITAGKDRSRRPMKIDNCCVSYRKFNFSESVHDNCTILVDENGFSVKSKESNYEINHEFIEFEESWYGEPGRNEFVCKLMLYQPLSRENVYSIKIKTSTEKDKKLIASFVGVKNDTPVPEYMLYGHWKFRCAARFNQLLDARDSLLESQYNLIPGETKTSNRRESIKSPLYSSSDRSMETRTRPKRNMTPMTKFSSMQEYAKKVPALGGPTRSADSIRRRIESLAEKGKIPKNRQSEFDARKRNGKK